MKSHCNIADIQVTCLRLSDIQRHFHNVFHATVPIKKAGFAILVKNTVSFQLSDLTIDSK